MGQYYHGLIYNPNCDTCPLRGRRQVHPDGVVPNNLILVGEGPGRDEEREGRAFVGPTGKLLWYLCESMGIPARETMWVTNTTLCRPTKIRLSNGAEITAEEVKWKAAQHCHQRLIHEINYVINGNPNAVIIPIGKVALWSCSTLSKPKIRSYRGSVITQDWSKVINKNNDLLREDMVKRGLEKFLGKACTKQ